MLLFWLVASLARALIDSVVETFVFRVETEVENFTEYVVIGVSS